ncbi:3-isopropylmalate dehydratase small subunit [Novosphingobium sp.]|uniref:3-isopropylmalate dehydratase small subunit n=1 Tax=Novosphingobium sp. TaxID=1874826 RepID=UPI0026215B97|nr:3-isopropylmalate dehydratase small subunit [Novosphingobium sp.]
MPAERFLTVSGPAAVMREDNIDTDIIFPARFLLITARAGLGRYAFHDRRYAADGSEIAGYVLNDERFRNPPVIVAGANFGSGSSREQAVWALHGLGVRAVIAPGFGEIFHGNCLRNGIVPIALRRETVAALMDAAKAGRAFTVDLERQELAVIGLPVISFAIAPEQRLALLNGWDETDQVLNQHGPEIAAFEQWQQRAQPWLHA